MSLNKVMLLGNLGKDPESKETKTGTVVCNLSVATSKKVNGQERTEWHRVVCFGKTAEFAIKYLGKGRMVFIEGELQTRSWEQDGQKKYMTEVVANRLEAVGPRGDAPAGEPVDGNEGGNNDIPF